MVDEVIYGTSLSTPDKGEALARTEDGIDTDSNTDWAITTNITPGEANVIVAPVVVPPAYSGGGSTLESPVTEVKKLTTSTVKTTTATVKKLRKSVWFGK